MASAGTVTVDFAAETAKFTAELKKVNTSLKNLEGGFASVESIAKLAIGALSVRAVFNFAKSAILAADALGDAAERAGIAVDEFSRLKFAAEQSDVEFGAFTTGIKKFQIAISNAADGSKTAQALFASFGVEVGKIADLSISDQLGAVADAFVRIKDPADRTRLAVELFGKAGNDLVPLLARGREGIAELTAEADRLGITMTDSATKGIDRATKSLGKFFDAIGARTASVFGDLVTGIFGSGDALVDLNFELRGLIALQSQLQQSPPPFDNVQLAITAQRIAEIKNEILNIESAARAGDQMNLLPLPWLDRLQSIDIVAIQAMKIPVDELAEAYRQLAIAAQAAATARNELTFDIIETGSVDHQKEVQSQITSDLQTELEGRANLAQYYRDLDVSQEVQAQQAIQGLREATYRNGIAALQAFAGRSKSIATAVILVQKAMALREAFMAGVVAVQKAAASAPPPYNVPAILQAKLFAGLNLAAIAATGIGQIGSINSSPGSGAPIGSPANPVFTNDEQPGATQQSVVQVIVQGNIIGNRQFVDELLGEIRDAVDDRDVVIISSTSRNAKELVGA